MAPVMWLFISDESRLCAAEIEGKSAVNIRLILSIGPTAALPPPVAPPFMPKHGPIDGSLRFTTTFSPSIESASASPIDIVVFPSPDVVGVIEVTRISRPSLFPSSRWNMERGIFAMWFPYLSMSCSERPSIAAMMPMSCSSGSFSSSSSTSSSSIKCHLPFVGLIDRVQ